MHKSRATQNTTCKPGLCSQNQCVISLMLLRVNEGKSLQPHPVEKVLMKMETDHATYLYSWFWNEMFNHEKWVECYGVHILVAMCYLI